MNNYFELYKLTEALQFLVGWKIIEAYSQEKNQLTFQLFSGGEEMFMHFTTDSALNSLFVREQSFRKKRNSADIFPDVCGQIIQSVKIVPDDREIIFQLSEFNLNFYFYGGAKSNCLLTGNDGKTKDAFKNSSELAGKPFTQNKSDKNPEDLLEKQMGKKYLAAIVRDEISESYSPEELSKLKNELLSSETFYILLPDRNSKKSTPVFSLIPLKDYPEVFRKFSDINEALSFYYSYFLSSGTFFNAKSRYLNLLNRKIEKLNKKIEMLKESDAHTQRAEKYDLWGNLLSSRPDLKSKMGTEIKVDDWEGKEHLIPLKAEKSLLENAIRFFEKSKSIYKNLERNIALEPLLRKKIADYSTIHEKIFTSENFKQLEKLMKENKEINDGQSESGQSAESKFRVFKLGNGYTLYVGKNAANNDELTMRFAKANDLWFHARGTSGSHAVLKSPTSERPPKQILQKAASIAAYYSGARNAGFMPVAYTFKKYIHKPKGANPGAVVLSREEVIMVKPGLPEDLISDSV